MGGSFQNTLSRLRALGEPTRLRVLSLLRAGDLSVGELVQVLGLSQPRLSHQLKILATAGLVDRLPEGAWVFYRAVTTGPEGEMIDTALRQAGATCDEFSRDADQLTAIQAARADAAATYFDSVADTWDTVRALQYPEQAVESAVLDVIGPGPFRHIIDIGTGTGRMLTLLAGLAQRAEGLDLSHKMLTVARNNLARASTSNAAVRQGDACATPFETGSADLVIMHQVLHFIDTPRRVLTEADRLLEPGGQLVIVDFAPHTLEFLRDDHGHRRLGVAEDALRDWASDTALDIACVRRFDPPASNPSGLSVQIWKAMKRTERIADATEAVA